MTIKTGFYICHCGINIAYKVRVKEVADFARQLRHVVVARDYKFMCSDPGQSMIEQDIREMGLTCVVVASCSPRLHGKTFMGACRRAGLNPYFFHMASVREQVSWVTADEDQATDKAKSLVAAAIARVNYQESLETRYTDVHPDMLVVGGGIAGMQAALDIGDSGHKAYLVEKNTTIGGHMLQFDKTFPTLDCAACIGTPKSVALLHCIGSRDVNYHEYCSRVCCMYALKYTHLIKEKVGHDTDVYDFYIDMRCFGEGYEEFYRRCQQEGTQFIRGKVAEISDRPQSSAEQGKLIAIAEDTLLGEMIRVPVDMAILCTAMEARKDANEVGRIFGVNTGEDGFFLEEHPPKLGPLNTATDGVFLAGCCQKPMDIPDTVSQASGAAAKALSLATRGQVEVAPTISWIDPDVCIGCQVCIGLCPYTAIEFDNRRQVSVVNAALCKGCGSCLGFCPSGAARSRHFKSQQIFAEIDGIMDTVGRLAVAC